MLLWKIQCFALRDAEEAGLEERSGVWGAVGTLDAKGTGGQERTVGY